ncbi:succinate dehydrogenase, hydrophobic membrane anchor protein [Chthonobacter rhizosphaerae]|uniref:succinate dehydrogenase, hydrophobic membrane anchor protein n=1 Tax=Chthonobacter rhizosphaerae TaxID=2735553 RepID=UPI0015EF5281|nr:succinate dehydrogenase, hydrophobic membrane anchor protein [Chthonobacter rhizosphaerae]
MPRFSNMRTPLAKVRGLGSAHEGTEHFWRQRLTAVSNLFLTTFFVGVLLSLQAGTYADVIATLSHPVVAILLIGMMISVTLHMRIGMQVIIEDYVHDDGLRVVAIGANTFFAAIIAIASVFALLKIAFGA